MVAKLAVTADLHLPITKPERIAALVEEVRTFGPDAVVLGGDLGESYIDFERCLKLVREGLTCPVWVLAGNHDLWARPPYDSSRLWLEVIPRLVADADCRYLEGTSFRLGDVAVTGSIAWYDYSAADPGLEASALQFAQNKYLHNADALRIDWEWADPEFAENVGRSLLVELDCLEADGAVRQVVVVTHVPLLEGQMLRKPGNADWGFSNAYFGNLTLGAKVLAYRKVSHILSGHTHVGRQFTQERAGALPVEVHVVASEYEHPAWVGLTL
jgi:3',5'-cyclic AMP phosphodiesterase CpdA